MMHRILATGLMLAGLSSPVFACEMESWGAMEYVAGFTHDGMDEQERLAAEQRALQDFHDAKMAEAKAAFLKRFKLKIDDGEPVSTEAVSVVNRDPAAESDR